MRLFLWIFMLLYCISCGSGNTAYQKKSNPIANKSTPQKERILFATYQIKKNKNNALDVKLKTKKIVAGNLKKNTPFNATTNTSGISCLVLDAKQNVLERIYVENPLIKNIEYINNTGELQRKQIVLDSAFFYVRIQLPQKAVYITTNLLNELSKDNL